MNETIDLAKRLEIMILANILLMDINKQLLDTLQWVENKAHVHVIHGNENTDWKDAMEIIEDNARLALNKASIVRRAHE